MNKKFGLIIASTFIIFVGIFYTPLTFGQELVWDYVQVSAYGTGLEEQQPPVGSFTFNVVAAPSGSDVPNTIILVNDVTGENYTHDLSAGDEVSVTYMDFTVSSYSFVEDGESGNLIIFFEGQASYVRVNRQVIPEFSSILVIPLFVAVTILVIVYRIKRSK
jgi:hypothetical protein